MKLLNIVILAVAGTAVAQQDMADMTKDSKSKDGKSMSTKAMCNKMFKLEGLEKLAANQTMLEQRTKNNATKIAAIKDRAKKAEPELKALQGNATLVTECGKIAADRKEKRQCGQMHRLERLEKITANATLLSSVTKGNSTKAEALKKKAAERKATLETLQKNTTLTAFCAGVKDTQTCRHMKGMQRQVDNSKNQTFLDKKFKGNATKIDNYKKRAAKVEEKLKALQANSTLMAVCQKQTTGGTGGGRTSSPSNGSNSIQAFGVSASILALFTAGLVLL